MRLTRPRSLLFAVTLVAALTQAPGALAGPAVSAPPAAWPVTPRAASAPEPLGVLNGTHQILTFAGQVTNPTPFPLVNVPVTPVCAVTCTEFTFVNTSPTPFLVSLKDAMASMANGWDLAVYDPAGRAVAAANGIGANGQAVEIDGPSHGRYTIVVTYTYAEDPGAAYTGEVRQLAAPAWAPPGASCGVTVGTVTDCFLLPQLRAVPAYDLHVSGLPPVASTPLGFPFPVDAPTPSSCYADESLGLTDPSVDHVTNPVQRCLRFTSDVTNVGAGTLDIGIPWVNAGGESGFVPGGCHTEQFVRTTGGQVAKQPAGDCGFHPAHGHFHYRDLISFSLYGLDVNGGVGAPIGRSLKESFCLADDDYFGFGTPGPNGPRNYVGQPDCNVPSDVNGEGATVHEGVSPGWGDVYTWDTPDQFIDITGLADGIYDLVERTNPNNTLLVAGAAQTCALTQLQLSADTVTLLSTTDSVPCPAV